VSATTSCVRRHAALARAIVAVFGWGIVFVPALSAQPPRLAPPPSPAASLLTWPPPPAPARIRFVRALDPELARGKRSMFSKIVRVIIGAHDEPQMQQPYGIAVGPDGKVYVADTFARTIHVFDVVKSRYSTISVDGDSLIGVAVAGGRLFVTDSVSGRVLCLDAKGKVRWTLGRESGFLRPTGIAAADDRLYVVDTIMNCIVVVSLSGQRMASFGERGGEAGQFNFPTNIVRTADGQLLVTDTMNFRVQVFDGDGRYLRTFGHLGDGAGDFAKPKGIAVDSAGHIYVVEGFHDVVQIFDDEGRLLLAFGESGSGSGQFWLPSGIAIVNDVVYVADSANRRLQVFEYLRDQP
jgi:DNA-binding beta-propeller fold protein YncE